MNYIKQMNTFYHQIEINPLSSSAISLWHALLHINNKTGWQDTFTVAGAVLRMKSGLQESAFKRARNELTDKGYITYTSNGSNRAPAYQVVSLAMKMDQPAVRSETEAEHHTPDLTTDHTTDASNAWDHSLDQATDENTDQNTDRTPAPLVKQRNKPKRNKTAAAANKAIAFYQDNVGTVSPFLAESITNWCRNSGEALVIEAIKRALKRQKANWGYVEGILNAWTRNQIQTVDEAQAEERTFRQARSWHGINPAHQEVIPDWFRQQKNRLEQNSKTETSSQLTPEQRSETERLLAKFGSKSG